MLLRRALLPLLIAVICAFAYARWIPPPPEVAGGLRAARSQVLSGELPLWDRQANAPLLANGTLALAHPITIVAGITWLATALRMLLILGSAFVLFRAWDIGPTVALFGAAAWAFGTGSTLAAASLPLALAAAQELALTGRLRSYLALSAALALAILAGDPYSAIWISAVTFAFGIFLMPRLRVAFSLALVTGLAVGMTAMIWMPARDVAWHVAKVETPFDLTRLVAFITPNAYGSTGDGYTGIITLALAALGLGSPRREKWFFLLLLLTGQPMLWVAGCCALATLGLCRVATGSARRLFPASGVVALAVLTVWFARAEYFDETYAWTEALIPLLALSAFVVCGQRRLYPAVAALVLTVTELVLVAHPNPGAAPLFRSARYEKVRRVRQQPQGYFAVERFAVQAETDDVLAPLAQIPDLRRGAIVHDIPPAVVEEAPHLNGISAPRRVIPRSIGARESLIDVAAARGWSLIVSSDVDWPGWRAYWNGRRIPVVTVDGAFAGAFVPPEQGTLILRYWPAPFIDGLRITAASLLLAVLVLLMARRRFRAEKEDDKAQPSRTRGELSGD